MAAGQWSLPNGWAVIVARQPRNRIGWLCCALGLLVGPAAFAQDYAWYTLVHLPGGLARSWLSSWPWYPAIILGLIVLYPLISGCCGASREQSCEHRGFRSRLEADAPGAFVLRDQGPDRPLSADYRC
jgi:hypothetical protein